MPASNQRKTVGSVLNKLIERVNSNIRRLRILEQESSVYKTRLNSVEQELINQRNRSNRTIKDLNEKISGLEENILKFETTTKEIINQLKKVTTTTKIKELEHLIDIYNPIKSQFVTKEEVEKILDNRLRGE